jgi:hypothetical protein
MIFLLSVRAALANFASSASDTSSVDRIASIRYFSAKFLGSRRSTAARPLTICRAPAQCEFRGQLVDKDHLGADHFCVRRVCV